MKPTPRSRCSIHLGCATVACALAPLAPLTLLANTGATSANYTILPMALPAGGGAASSANYSSFSTIGESSAGTATSGNYRARYGFSAGTGPMEVTGRHVFYNQSSWDGGSADADARDDNAIAPDKYALLPGGKATFDNYTSYNRGLNGIMVDLPLEGTPTASDFTFRRGNAQDTSTWTTAPTPTTIAVRPAAGEAGADRVTLIWPSGAIQKQWLQVTVLPTANTGLSEPDVFYFGNAPGETGNSSRDANVGAIDAFRILSGVSANAAIDNRFDLNRDGKVGAGDRLTVLNNVSALSPLVLLNLSGSPALTASPGSGHTPVLADVSRSPEGLRVRWVSNGTSVSILSAEDVDATHWETYGEAGAGISPGDVVEVVLPLSPEGVSRFYRFESQLQ